MTRISFLFLAPVLALAQSTADPVVLTVGPDKITQSEFERMLSALPEQQQTQAKTPDGRKRFAEQYSEMRMLVQEAKRAKLDQDAGIKAKIALQSEQVLANAAYLGFAKAVGDAQVNEYYKAHESEWQEVSARHILIRFQGSRVPMRDGQKDLSEAEAQAKAADLKKKIAAGAKFADLAKAESDDVASGADGGNLGAFERGAMIPEFEDAAFSLPIGQVSDPVKSAFGYHLILVDKRGAKSLEEMRAEIQQRIAPEASDKGLEELKKKTTVTLNDQYFSK